MNLKSVFTHLRVLFFRCLDWICVLSNCWMLWITRDRPFSAGTKHCNDWNLACELSQSTDPHSFCAGTSVSACYWLRRIKWYMSCYVAGSHDPDEITCGHPYGGWSIQFRLENVQSYPWYLVKYGYIWKDGLHAVCWYRWTWIWQTQWDQENWSVICKIHHMHMTNTWYA